MEGRGRVASVLRSRLRDVDLSLKEWGKGKLGDIDKVMVKAREGLERVKAQGGWAGN